MNARRLAYRLALFAVVLVTAWLFAPKPNRPPSPPVVPQSPPSVAPDAADSRPSLAVSSPLPAASQPFPPNAGNAARSAASVLPAAPSAPPQAPVPQPATLDPAAAVAVDQVRLMLRDYRTLTGENPVGTNAEIMRTLMGDNPRQATLGPPEGQTLNTQGEIVDRWDTPLFFHQLSKTVMEIRSAGPDRVMWTEDDVVAK